MAKLLRFVIVTLLLGMVLSRDSIPFPGNLARIAIKFLGI